MKSSWNRKNIVISVLSAIALFALLFDMKLVIFDVNRTPKASIISSSSIIMDENVHLGTANWQIPGKDRATTEIQAYANTTSVTPGEALTFFVSTEKIGTPYSISIYRLGWYGGLGGRLMFLQTKQVGIAQGYFNANSNQLIRCQSCRVDEQTGLIEANWRPSYTLTVPLTWVTGVYLAKFSDANNKQTYVPFDVRGNSYSRYIVVTPDTTNEAYNNWGGYSLYNYSSFETDHAPRAVKVSFDRPYAKGYGSSNVLTFDVNAIHWFERQGYDLSYMSSIDLQEAPGQLLQHRAFLSLGHDEYWTKEMRDGVEYARDHGMGLAFLGADDIYWQMRFEPDSAGIPDRTIVCYKVQTADHDLAQDPLYGKDNTRVTALWRDPLLNRPENALIGIMYSSFTVQHNFPWQLSPQANSPLLDSTGLQAGYSYGCGIVGYEWDRIFANGATPSGLKVLGTSGTESYTRKPDVSNTTYYIAPSGAMVFASGSISWTAALDSYRFGGDTSCIGQKLVIPGMQKLLENVMNALVIKHSSH